MQNFSLTVLNPKGNDPCQSFPNHAGEVDSSVHAPISYHAYAACTGGTFLRSVDKAISLNQPVLLLINVHEKRCYNALQVLKKAGLPVAISLKETGSHQFAEKFGNPKKLRLFKKIVALADGVITPTKALVTVYRALRPDSKPESVKFIPIPYPVMDKRWDFSIPLAERKGIFLGTRELNITSRNHIASLIILSSYIKRHKIKLGLINKDGRQLRQVIKELDIPNNLIDIQTHLNYPNYLKFISKHRIVMQLDQSMVPGQVAGDATLTRMICVGGNGAIDQLIFPDFSHKFHSRDFLMNKINQLLNDDVYYHESLLTAQKNAINLISYPVIAKSLQEFFEHELHLTQHSS